MTRLLSTPTLHYFPALMLYTPSLFPDYCQHQPCITFLPSCCTLLHCSQIIVNTNPALLSCPHVAHSFTVPRLLSTPILHYFPALMLYTPSLFPDYCQHQPCITFLPSCCTLLHFSQIIVNTNPALLSCPHVVHSFTVPRLLSTPILHYFPALMLYTPSLSPDYCQRQSCITFLPSCCTLLHCPQIIVNTNPALLSCPHVVHSFTVPRLLSTPILHYFPALMLYTPSLSPDYCQRQSCITFLPSCCTLLHCSQIIVNTNPALLSCPHVVHSSTVPRLLSTPTLHYFPALMLHTPSLFPDYCQRQPCITFLPSCCTLLHCSQIIVNANPALLSCPHVAHSFTFPRLLSTPTLHYFPALMLYTPSLFPDYCQHQPCITFLPSCCTLLHCPQIIVNTNPALLSCPHVAHSFTVPRLLSTPTLHYFPALMLHTPSLFPDYCQHQSCITFLPSCCTLLHCSQIIVNTNPALLSCPHVVHSFTVPRLLSTPTLHYFPALMLHTPSLFPDYCQHQPCITFLPSCCTLLHCSQIIVNANPALLSCPHVVHSFTVPRLLSTPTLHYFPALMLYTPLLFPDYCQHQPCITFLPSCCTLLHFSQIIVNTNPALLSCPHVVHSFTVPRLLSTPILHYFPALMLHTPSLFPDYCQCQSCITFLPSCCTHLHCSQIIVNTNPALLSCPHVVHSFTVPRLLSTPTLHYFPALMLYTPPLFPDYCQHQPCITFLPSCCTLLHCSQIIVNTNPALLSCPHVVHSFTVPRLLSTPTLHYFPALMLYTPSLFPDYCQHQSCITFLPSCCTLLHCSQIIVNTNPALLSCPHVVHSFTVPRLLSTPTLHYFPALMLYTPPLFPDYCQHQPCITFLPSCCTLLHCSQIIVNTNPALLSCPHVAHTFTVPRLLSTPTLHYFPALMLYTPPLFPDYCQHQPCITFLPSCCTLLHCSQIIVNTNPALLSCPHVVHSFTFPRLLSMPTLHYFPALMLYTPPLFPDYCQHQPCITFLPSCCTLLHCSQIIVNTNPALLSCPHVVHSFTVPRLLSTPTLHYFPALMLYTPSLFPDYCQHQPCITFLPSCCTLLHCSQIIVNANPALLSCPHVVHSSTVPRLLSTPTLHYFPALMLYTPSLFPDYCQRQPCITFLPSCCTLLHCSQIIVNTNPALLSCPHVVHSFTVPRLLSTPTLHYFPVNTNPLMLYTPSLFPDYCQCQPCITFLPSCCTLLHCSQIIVNTNPALLSCPHVVHSSTVPRLLSTPTLHYFPALMLYTPSLFPDYCQRQPCITFLPSCCTLLHCSQIIVNTNPALLSCPHVVHSFTVPRLLSTPTLHYFPALMLYTPSLFPDYCQCQPCITFLPSCCTLLHCSQIIVNTNPALLSCPHVVHSSTVPRLLSTPILHYFPALMLYTPPLFPDYCQHQPCITFLPSCCTLLHFSQIIVNANPALLSCPHVAHSSTVPRLLSTPILHYFPALMLYTPSLFPDYCQHQSCITFLPSCCTLLHFSQIIVNANPALLSCPHVAHSSTVPRLLSTPILHYFPALMLYTPPLFPDYCQHQSCITFLPSCCTLLHCSQIIVNTNPALLSCPHVVHSFTVPRLLSMPTLHYFPALMLYTPPLFPDYCQHQPCITFLPSCCTLLHCSQIIVNTNPALLSCPHIVHSFTFPRLLSTPTLHYFPALMLYTPSLFPDYCQRQPCITFLPSCCTLLHCSQIIVNTNPALLSCPHVVHSFTVPRLLSTPTLHYFPALMLYTPSLFPDYCQHQPCITFLPSCCTLLHCSQIIVNANPALLSCPHVVHSFTVPRLLSTPTLHYFPALMLYTPSLFPDYCQHQPCITFLPSCCTLLHCSQIIVNTNPALLSCPHVVHSFTERVYNMRAGK